jgi:hypothetical protein
MTETMGSHQSSRMISGTWLTPPAILAALGWNVTLDRCSALGLRLSRPPG